jgi:hypothetical protein
LVVLELVVCIAALISDNVSHITDVSNLRCGTSMGLAVRVKVGAGSLASLDKVT